MKHVIGYLIAVGLAVFVTGGIVYAVGETIDTIATYGAVE